MPPTITDARALPAPVLERIDGLLADLPDARRRGLEVEQRGRLLEARTITRLELREDDAGAPILDGYATVWDHPYDVAGGPPWGWSETIAAGAATKSLLERDDVRLLVNHDGIPLARTRSGTLTLDADDVGLRVEAELDPASPLVAGLASAMRRGDLDEMSFAFRVLRQEWNADYTERTITELELFDVSVVTYPANPATVAQLRHNEEEGSAATRSAGSARLARAYADRIRIGA